MSEVERLVTVVDLDDRNPGGHSARAHLYAALRSGKRIVLLDDRGWSGSAAIDEETLQEVADTARMVVGPDGPGPGETVEQMEACYWQLLVSKLHDGGFDAEAGDLTGLAHDVEISERLRSRLLMNHLVGRWTMTGTLGGQQTIHDVEARWLLKREYVQLHEVSRERGADGEPAYEAIVLLSWHVKTSEFMCAWLDNTAGGGLSPEGIAHGRQSGDSIPLVFALSQRASLHTTFSYNRSADTWRLTIDDVTDAKSSRFGDVTLTRKD
jgi:hypothetical protein